MNIKTLCSVICIVLISLILSTTFFSGGFNSVPKNIMPNISPETCAYIGSLTSLTLAISFVVYRHKMKYQSEQIGLVIFCLLILFYFTLMNIISIIISIIVIWHKKTIGVWYFGFSITTISSVILFWIFYANANGLEKWPVTLTKKVGFYKKIVKNEVSKSPNYEADILSQLSGKIDKKNYTNVKINIHNYGLKLQPSFYNELFLKADSKDKPYVIDLSIDLNDGIKKITNLDVKWIINNYQENESFIYECLSTYGIEFVDGRQIDILKKIDLQIENNLINFTLNFINTLEVILARIKNPNVTTIKKIMEMISVRCSEYQVTKEQTNKIKPLFQSYSKTLSDENHISLVSYIIGIYENEEESMKKIKKLLFSLKKEGFK